MLKKSPNLAHFLWWRVVADEAHEILTLEEAKQTRKQQKANIAASLISQQEIRAPTTQSPGLKELSRLKSRYRWYVTGTPFPHAEKSLAAAMKVCLGKTLLFIPMVHSRHFLRVSVVVPRGGGGRTVTHERWFPQTRLLSSYEKPPAHSAILRPHHRHDAASGSASASNHAHQLLCAQH